MSILCATTHILILLNTFLQLKKSTRIKNVHSVCIEPTTHWFCSTCSFNLQNELQQKNVHSMCIEPTTHWFCSTCSFNLQNELKQKNSHSVCIERTTHWFCSTRSFNLKKWTTTSESFYITSNIHLHKRHLVHA